MPRRSPKSDAAAPAAPPPDPFAALLAAKETKNEATALRKRLAAKTLARDRVKVAADLGHAASWLVDRRTAAAAAASPPFRRFASGTAVAEHLDLVISRHSAPAKVHVFERRHWVDESGAERNAGGFRTRKKAGDELEWPDWGAPMVLRAAVVLGARAVARLAASRPEEDAPRLALAAVEAACARRDADAAREAERQGQRAARLAERLVDPMDAAAARLLAAAGGLAERSIAKKDPGLLEGDHRLLDEAERMGIAPDALFELLARELAAWALGEETAEQAAKPARAYRATEWFAEGEPIDHAKFGRGIVRRVRDDKIEVAFGAETRTLVHGLGRAAH